MRILGIDPSLRRTGYGVIEVEGNSTRCLEFGAVVNPASRAQADCLLAIFQTLSGVIEKYHPEDVAMEAIIYVQNTRTAITMGSARGAALVAAANAGLGVSEYPAKLVKKAVTGMGAARKEQVGFMIRSLLGMTETPGSDEADALAIALAHANTRKSPVGVRRKLGS